MRVRRRGRRRGGLTPRWLLPGKGSGQWTADSRGQQSTAACPPLTAGPSVLPEGGGDRSAGSTAPGLRSVGCCGFHLPLTPASSPAGT